MASALDPRFKLKYVSEDNRGSIEDKLTAEMKSLINVMKNAPLETAAMAPDVTEDAAAPKKKKKGLGSFFKVTTDKTAGPLLQQDHAIALELQSYLQTETLDAEEDPLKWWRESQRFIPRLSNLARKYLCIPATSCSSERVFSTGGNIVSCSRSSLKPDHVDRLVFLAKNL
ncbi:E3 SUMO-protein ligase ZBED1-like isoform X1 [Triplophysa rosa]|uniref:E3 SUMO-protein ligase ZBED1-like isoform X1 n=1 Tax=Triplophysa rosa TaxID=992332 RepID=UPI002545D5A3|nr:E3 SUMO-protein ligase ZBED1-like isoform X1 [Triplophysa rosa]